MCKVRGFTLNFTNSQLINFENVKTLVINPSETSTITVTNPQKICREKSKRKLYNREEEKNYQMVYTKCRRLDNYDTEHYGYCEDIDNYKGLNDKTLLGLFHFLLGSNQFLSCSFQFLPHHRHRFNFCHGRFNFCHIRFNFCHVRFNFCHNHFTF